MIVRLLSLVRLVRLALTIVGALWVASTVARADGTSPLTLGVGAGVGLHRVGGDEAPEATAFVNSANVRLKLAQLVGLDLAYDLGRDERLAEPSADLQFAAKLRASVLLYPYAGERIACYLAGGVGALSLAELTRLDGPGLSYHAGVGFEVHLADHVSVDLSFMLVAPGVDSIERAAVAQVEAAYARGGADAVRRLDAPGLDDLVSVKNHEIMVRLFVFL